VTAKRKEKVRNPENFAPWSPKWEKKMQYLSYSLWVNMQMLSELNKDRYWGIFECSKHQSKTRIARNKMVEPVNVKIYVFHPLLDEVER
jgi:hypothetical protein